MYVMPTPPPLRHMPTLTPILSPQPPGEQLHSQGNEQRNKTKSKLHQGAELKRV